jgi:hypothetical protein
MDELRIEDIWEIAAAECDDMADHHRRGGSTDVTVNALHKMAAMFRDPNQQVHFVSRHRARMNRP